MIRSGTAKQNQPKYGSLTRHGILRISLKLLIEEEQCVGAGSGSGPIRNYLQDPDPELEIWILKGSGIKLRYIDLKLYFYLITM